MMRVIVVLTLAALGAGSAAVAVAQTGRYQPLGADRQTPQTQQMVDALRALIDEADRARAADRRFLRDLRDLAARYDWPWRERLVSVDMTDPALLERGRWRVPEGRFRVDRRDGLIPDLAVAPAAPADAPKTGAGARKRDNGRDLALALLGSLLEKPAGGGQPRSSAPAAESARSRSTRATIATDTPVPRAFAARFELRALDRAGSFDIALAQRRSGYGYRLSLALAPMRGDVAIAVRRFTPRGASVIASSSAPGLLADGRLHAVEWTRGERGEIRVGVDGENVLSTVDDGLRDPFDRVELTHVGGRSAVRSLEIWGAPAR